MLWLKATLLGAGWWLRHSCAELPREHGRAAPAISDSIATFERSPQAWLALGNLLLEDWSRGRYHLDSASTAALLRLRRLMHEVYLAPFPNPML